MEGYSVEMTLKPSLQKILAALADEHTLKMFRAASIGWKASPETRNDLELTRKQYYTRLQNLLKLQLIKKYQGVYRHTTLGSIVADNQLKPLEEALSQYWNLVAADELKRSKALPDEEKTKIID